MKWNVGRFAIVGALVAAFLAAMAHVGYLRGLRETKQVVVTSREVGPFQKLDQSNLKLVELPADAVGEGAFTSLAEVNDHYARGLILPGEVVRKAHLVDAVGGALAARLTATGQADVRAMALKVTPDTGVANTVEPGDKVDVLVSFKFEGTQGRTTVSKIIAQGVPVLHTSFEKSENFSASREGTVVLQVRADLAEEIAFAQTSGTIWLLTTPYEASETQTEGVNTESFLRKYRTAAVTTPAAGVK